MQLHSVQRLGQFSYIQPIRNLEDDEFAYIFIQSYSKLLILRGNRTQTLKIKQLNAIFINEKWSFPERTDWITDYPCQINSYIAQVQATMFSKWRAWRSTWHKTSFFSECQPIRQRGDADRRRGGGWGGEVSGLWWCLSVISQTGSKGLDVFDTWNTNTPTEQSMCIDISVSCIDVTYVHYW